MSTHHDLHEADIDLIWDAREASPERIRALAAQFLYRPHAPEWIKVLIWRRLRALDMCDRDIPGEIMIHKRAVHQAVNNDLAVELLTRTLFRRIQ